MISAAQCLALTVQAWRAERKTVVLTTGCFDLLHPGHLRLLQECELLGDLLVVGVNGDATIRTLKGPDRPILPQNDRMTMLSRVKGVDVVIGFDEPDPSALIRLARPDVFVKGADYWGREMPELAALQEVGARLHLVADYLEGYSTTRIVNRIRERGS